MKIGMNIIPLDAQKTSKVGVPFTAELRDVILKSYLLKSFGGTSQNCTNVTFSEVYTDGNVTHG
jgi:hypothetical protein